MKLSQLTKILNGTLIGDDAEFKNISIDSRTAQNGDCFFAIKGEFFDGHDFISDVAKKNPAVVIVDKNISEKINHIKVKNTRQALITLARFYRESKNIPVAAITGSCGKTTTRALLENILKQKGNVLASQKSFNNDIGLPLTLLKLNETHDFIVLEIGANHIGEIASLTKIAQPTIATITMAAPVHIEGFGSVDNIARAKGEIFEGLTVDGTAVINIDDQYADFWKKLAGNHRVITFSREKKADVMAKEITLTPNGQATFTLVLPNNKTTILLPLLGEHNIINALAASATAFALDIPIELIKKGLETGEPVYGRLNEKKGFAGATIIDDSYNANPASVKAAIKIVTHRSENSILVLGDMLELGEEADQMHADIGLFAKKVGVKKLFCYGKNTALTANAFGKNAAHFESYDALIQALKPHLTKEIIVLVKGSRGMKMENVVNLLITDTDHGH